MERQFSAKHRVSEDVTVVYDRRDHCLPPLVILVVPDGRGAARYARRKLTKREIERICGVETGERTGSVFIDAAVRVGQDGVVVTSDASEIPGEAALVFATKGQDLPAAIENVRSAADGSCDGRADPGPRW